MKKKNIHLSHQRLMVLEYLIHNQSHPTVDKIFIDLQKSISTLSKTTVYNTLKVFVDAGLIRVISIDDNENRYDIVIKNHGHFRCESCGKIYNFAIDIDSFVSDELNEFWIKDKNVYFKGVCPKCLLNINNNE